MRMRCGPAAVITTLCASSMPTAFLKLFAVMASHTARLKKTNSTVRWKKTKSELLRSSIDMYIIVYVY